ncbi:MAG: glycosyltransferase [Spirochaetes bacterium]|nr:glycosyltransferase [Spirochaetota bacterium]
MRNIKVSVIIPVYNAGKHLPQCLNSLIEQSLREIEILCINDGSSDNSLKILREYALKDPRITVLEQSNHGAGTARNAGLSKARGKYLSFLDSDDYFKPTMLEESYKYAEDQKADIIIFDVWRIDDATGNEMLSDWIIRRDFLPKQKIFSVNDIPDKIFNFSHNVVWNKLFRRDFIAKNNLKFQEVPHTNDTLFMCRALLMAQRISVLDKKLLFYRNNLKLSLTSRSVRQKHPLCIYSVLSAIQQESINSGMYDKIEKSFANLALSQLIFNLYSTNGRAFRILYRNIRYKWSDEFGISGHDRDYFYFKSDYDHYLDLKDTAYCVYILKSSLGLSFRRNRCVAQVSSEL